MLNFNSNDLNALLPDPDETSLYQNNVKNQNVESYNDTPESWLWNGMPIDEIPDEYESFVYLMTNKITKKQYIGFKMAITKTTKTINGKRKKITIESDWKTYYSSSHDVLVDVGKYGRGNFVREIIMLCPNKSVGKYYEAYYQFTKNVLTENKKYYYNGIVNVRLNNKILKDFSKARTASFISEWHH